MKIEDLQDAIGQLDDRIVTETAKVRQKRRKPLLYRVGAVAAAVAIIVACFVVIQFVRRLGDPATYEYPSDVTNSSMQEPEVTGTTHATRRIDLVAGISALAMPEYPIMHKCPSEDLMQSDQEAFDKANDAWYADLQRQRNQPRGYQDGVMVFAQEANRLLLNGDGDNRIYSPLNVYLALSLLAETTGGDTRTEILQVLGVDTIEKLRAKANSLWNAHYLDDGNTTSLLANSIWLDKSLSVKQEAMQILQDTYKSSVFQGDMRSANMAKQLQKWLNEQTDNLLESSVDNVAFNEDTLMALASTILFRAKWDSEFKESDTAKGTFHTPSGSVETDFMYNSGSHNYYWGDKFAAVNKDLIEAGGMWFLLPDEDVNVNELLDDPQINALLQNRMTYENQKYVIVNFKVPKFDVMSDIHLEETLQELGIKTAFTDAADFSPISKNANLYVSDINHAARVMIDEQGVTGAAYTLTLDGMGVPPDEIVDFILDRPFLFVVQGHDGVPLFVGVVNQP